MTISLYFPFSCLHAGVSRCCSHVFLVYPNPLGVKKTNKQTNSGLCQSNRINTNQQGNTKHCLPFDSKLLHIVSSIKKGKHALHSFQIPPTRGMACNFHESIFSFFLGIIFVLPNVSSYSRLPSESSSFPDMYHS